MSDWVAVFDAVKATGGNPIETVERALQHGVSAEQVLEGVFRALSFEGHAAFEDWEALPPGCLDTRVFMQPTWWVDVLRRPHRITEMSDAYVENVICFLRGNAEYFYEKYRFGHPMIDAMSAEEWLEATPLMRALLRKDDA